MMCPSQEYRERMRYAIRTLSTPEEEAILLGEPVNRCTMDTLEAYIALMFDKPLPPPPGYKKRRR
jgi:hypothetical protein